jgi:hypothetical protein
MKFIIAAWTIRLSNYNLYNYNILFLLNRALWLIYFKASKSSHLTSRSGKAGSYTNQTALIQQIAHAVFDPLGVRQHFPFDSNF